MAVSQDTPSLLDQPAPDFELPATGGHIFRMSEMRGKPLVIYFYPKDNTPGCTTEGLDFRDLHREFAAHGCTVVGVSRDNMRSHENFKAKMQFPFELLSDTDEKVCELFSVIKIKNMYGKRLRGIERSTFAIDRKGIVRREWRGVKVPGHVREVLDFIRTLD